MKRDMLQLGISAVIVLSVWHFGKVNNLAAMFLTGLISSFLLGKYLPSFKTKRKKTVC